MPYMLWLILCLCPISAFAGCEVKEFFYQLPSDSTPTVQIINYNAARARERQELQMQGGVGALGALGGLMSHGTLEEESPERQIMHKIWGAIEKRDLAMFTNLMPANINSRRELLQKTHALSSAYGKGALKIVKQILAWEPASAVQLDEPNLWSQTLQTLASNWLARAPQDGYPVENPLDEKDQVELIKMLLDAGADPDGYQYRLSPLGNIASVPPSPSVNQAAEILLQHGASIESRDEKNRAPLSFAAEQKNGALVQLMLQVRQPSQRALDEALIWSPVVESNQALAMLLERGANINADGTNKYEKGEVGFHPAQAAAARFKSHGERQPMRLMIRYKVDPNPVLNCTDSALMNVMHEHELMKGLLDLKADPNYRNCEKDTPLHMAVRHPKLIKKMVEDTRPLTEIELGLNPALRAKSVALLLEYGADPNVRGSGGLTPLMLAGPEDAESINALVAKGGKVVLDDNLLSYYRQYKAPMGPVSWALVRGNDALASALLVREGSISSEDCGAVFYAAQSGAGKTLAVLLGGKAKVYAAKGDRGITPLIIAAQYGQVATVKILLDRRASKVNEATPFAIESAGGHGFAVPALGGGYTALMAAAQRNHTDVVEELIKYGADVNRADYSGKTAMDYALGEGHSEVVSLLKLSGAHQ